MAGPDVTLPVGRLVTLNGSASYDPDGPDEKLIENWVQIGGPDIPGFDGGDFVSFFTPQQVGEYRFRLDVADQKDKVSDTLTVTVVPCLDDVLDGLTARWMFEEGVGPRALDSSPGASHGILSGAVWRRGGAIELDGVDDAILLPRDFAPSGSAITVTAWFRADDFGVHDARILSKASGSSDADHYVMLSTIRQGQVHRLRFRLKAGGSTTTLVATSGDLATSRWTHAAAVYDGTQMRLFLDGVQVGARAKAGKLDTKADVDTAIGNQPPGASGGGRPFDGALDDVRVYGRALAVAEIGLLGSARLGTVPALCSCAPDLGFRGPGGALLSVCGEPATRGGGVALRLTDAAPRQPGLLVFSLRSGQVPVFGGTLVPVPIDAVIQFEADATGRLVKTGLGRVQGKGTAFLQAVGLDPQLPGGAWISNAVRVPLPF